MPTYEEVNKSWADGKWKIHFFNGEFYRYYNSELGLMTQGRKTEGDLQGCSNSNFPVSSSSYKYWTIPEMAKKYQEVLGDHKEPPAKLELPEKSEPVKVKKGRKVKESGEGTKSLEAKDAKTDSIPESIPEEVPEGDPLESKDSKGTGKPQFKRPVPKHKDGDKVKIAHEWNGEGRKPHSYHTLTADNLKPGHMYEADNGTVVIVLNSKMEEKIFNIANGVGAYSPDERYRELSNTAFWLETDANARPYLKEGEI